MSALRERIERFASGWTPDEEPDVRAVVAELLRELESGRVRAASRGEDGSWRPNAWVKQGILLAFRAGRVVEMEGAGSLTFADKDTLAPRRASELAGVRVVPGGSAVRAGAHVGASCVLMPPCYVNVGAFVGEGSLIDSHALVGSCAQVGARVHVSAAAQIGGVLEPVGSLPVIVEDDAFVGGGAGLYEGVLVRRRAVLAAGVTLTRSSRVVDLVRETVHEAPEGGALEIPEGAVVVAGSRPASGAWARELGVHVSTPVIVRQRDARTDARAALEQALRP